MEHVRSLRESVTAEDIADGIILSHKGSKETLEKTIVLVEGKDDVDVYNSFKRAKTTQLYNEIKAWCDDNSLSSLIKT